MVGDDLAMDVATPQQPGIVAIWFDPLRRGLPKDGEVYPNHIIHELPELDEAIVDLVDKREGIEQKEMSR